MRKILIYKPYVLRRNETVLGNKTLNVTCVFEPSVPDRLRALFAFSPEAFLCSVWEEEQTYYMRHQRWFGPNDSSKICDEDTSAILDQFLSRSSKESGTKLVGML